VLFDGWRAANELRKDLRVPLGSAHRTSEENMMTALQVQSMDERSSFCTAHTCECIFSGLKLSSRYAKFGTAAPKCTDAAVETGPRGLCGSMSM
jgi:hypothetical protein